MAKIKIDCFFGSDTYSHIEIKSVGKSGSKIVFLFSQEDKNPISLGVVLSEEELCLKEKKYGFLEIIKRSNESGEFIRFDTSSLLIRRIDRRKLIQNIDDIYEIKVQKAILVKENPMGILTHRRRKKINIRPSIILGMKQKTENRRKVVMRQRSVRA